MFDDARNYGYARYLLWKNFNPSGIPGSCWELKIPASKFLAVVSALGWVVADSLQSIPKLLSLDPYLRRLCMETLVSPGCVPVSGWKKGKLYESKRLNKGFPSMCIFAVCRSLNDPCHSAFVIPADKLGCSHQDLKHELQGSSTLCIHRSENTNLSLISLNTELLQL